MMRILEMAWLAVAAFAPKNDCGTSKEATKEVATSAASNAPAMDVTAKQLFADYEANEVSADDKYKGNVLRVSGTISTIGKDAFDTPYVELAAANEILGVQCMFDDTRGLGSLKKGQKLIVRCKGDGKMGNVILRGCMIDNGSGVAPATSDSGPQRCIVRVTASGYVLDGKPAGRRRRARRTTCRTTTGAEVTVNGDARQGDLDELRAALEAAHVAIVVKRD